MNPLQPAPENATLLFNGNDLDNWETREGASAEWSLEAGVMTVLPGAGDIMTRERLTDFQLHLEVCLPEMPEATGQARANSGVFLQGRYEIQVLDSFGLNIPGMGDCGGIYDQFAPLVNANRAPLDWQTYDVVFRAARMASDGNVANHARISVIQNGLVVQNNVEVHGPTGGALDHDLGAPGPLLLQDHGNMISYRNLWAIELPLTGSDTYEPR